MGTRDIKHRVGTEGGDQPPLVLLVGQSPDFAEALRESLGPRLPVAMRLEEARDERVAVLIADLPEGGLDGLCALADLHASLSAPALVVLAFHDHRYQETRPVLEAIADAVVLKPVDFALLSCTVRRLAERADSFDAPPGSGEKEERP